jgi:hypothetical protein
MTHDEKVAYLLRDLGGREICPSTIAPPMYRQLWHLGLEVRPPHFASFWWNAGLRAFLFAAILVVSNSLISWWQGYGLLPALQMDAGFFGEDWEIIAILYASCNSGALDAALFERHLDHSSPVNGCGAPSAASGSEAREKVRQGTFD